MIPNGFYQQNTANIWSMMLEIRRDVYLYNYKKGKIEIDDDGLSQFHHRLRTFIGGYIETDYTKCG